MNLLTQKGKTFHTNRNHLIPHYPKERLHFPHIESYNEQVSEKLEKVDTSDMIQKDLYTSYENSGIGENDFDDDHFCNNDDDQSIMSDIEENKPVKLDDNHHHTLRPKFDSETLHYKP